MSTIPAIATTLIGVLAGEHLRSNRSQFEKALNLFFFGSLGVALGSLWDFWFPINKNLWTSSYVAFTGGMALIFIAACYTAIEVKRYTFWTKPFVILGTNAITVYVLSEIVSYIVYIPITLANVREATYTKPTENSFFTRIWGCNHV